MQLPGLPSLLGVPKHPPTCLDDVVPQPNDQGVGAIGLELVPKLVKDLVKLGQVPRPDGCREESGKGGRRKAGERESGLADFLLLLLPKWHLHPSPIKGREENSHWVPSHSGYSTILCPCRKDRQAGVGGHTLGQQEVGHERALERGLPELEPVRDLPEEQLHHDEQLMHLGHSETLSEPPWGLKPSLSLCIPRGLAHIPVWHKTPGDPKPVPVPVRPGRS